MRSRRGPPRPSRPAWRSPRRGWRPSSPRSRGRFLSRRRPPAGAPGEDPASASQQPQHEHVGADKQHHQALQDEREVGGELGLEHRRVEVALRGAGEERAEQQRGGDRSARRVAPEQRHRDADEPELVDLDVVGGDAELPAQHVERPGEPREQTAHSHHEHVVLRHAHAAVAGRLGVEADRADLVAGRGAVEQEPESDHGNQRDEYADVEALKDRIAPEDRQAGGLDHVVRHRERRLAVVLERAAQAEQVEPDVDRGVVEHDRRDHLVGPDRRLQRPRDPGPDGAGQTGGRDRQHDVQEAGHPGELRTHPHRGDRSDDVLPLAADVEQPGAERERHREAGQDQRRGDDQGLLQVERGQVAVLAGGPREDPLEAGALPDRLVGRDRVLADQQHGHAAEQEGEHRREHGHDDAAPADICRHPRRRGERNLLDGLAREGPALSRLVGQVAPLVHSARSAPPPVMAKPSSSSDTSGGNSPTISPSYIARMRSASARTSSNSSDTSRIPRPASRSAMRRLWTNSMAPTSRPRVGWCAIRRLGLLAISRATATFCWLPPDSELASAPGLPPRTSYSLRSSRARALMRPTLSTPRRLSGGLRYSRRARFSASVKSSTRRRRWRSSGMCATPASDAARTPAPATSLPPTLMLPASTLLNPEIASTSSCWPLPSTPASATISPARTWSESPRTASSSRSSSTRRSSTSSAGSPVEGSFFSTCSSTSRPTMSRARLASVDPSAGTVSMRLPRRRTVIRSAMSSTSPSLWLMKTIATPSCFSAFSTSNSSPASSAVSTAVGSSSTSTRASR